MKNIYKIIIVLLVGLAIFLWFTRPPKVDMNDYIKIDGKEYQLLSQKSDTVIKEVTIVKTEYKPSPPKIIKEKVLIPMDVDTASILQDYYTKKQYTDVIDIKNSNDSTDKKSYGTAVITDEVSQNEIQSRTALFNLELPEVTNITVVKEQEKNKFFYGLGLGTSITDGIYVGKGGVLLKTKQDKIIGLDVGAVSIPGQPIRGYVGGSVYWKLSLRKNK